MNKIKSILYFLEHFRRSGTSTFIRDIATVKRVMVVVANEKERERFDTKSPVYSIESLRRAVDQPPLPILFDNFAILDAARSALHFYEEREKECDLLRKEIKLQELQWMNEFNAMRERKNAEIAKYCKQNLLLAKEVDKQKNQKSKIIAVAFWLLLIAYCLCIHFATK